MQLSPPLTVLAILVVGVTTVSWLAPVQRPPAQTPLQVMIEIPAGTYIELAVRLRDRLNAEGQPLTVERWIADMADRAKVSGDDSASPLQRQSPSPDR
jgi:hypothetical protein